MTSQTKSSSPEPCERCGGNHHNPSAPDFTYGCQPQGAPCVLVLPASHVDHDLSEEQLHWLLGCARQALEDDAHSGALAYLGLLKLDGVEMPERLGTVPCGLHGPAMGDEPVRDDEVEPGRRGERLGDSRLCARPPRPTRRVSLIAGPHGGHPWVLYTAFGGPIAPREPFELPEGSPERAESEAFWSAHALSRSAS